MIKKIIKRYILSIVFFGISIGANAQTPDQLLGLPYNAPEVTALVLKFTNNKPEEFFLPYQQLYKQAYYKDGASFEFNTDISLYRILLYDSGYSYQKFKQALPKAVSWGMTVDQVQKKTGLLEFEETNPYVGKLPMEDYEIRYYFENGRLNHIVCEATGKLLEKKIDAIIAGNGLRLLPTGKPVEGNVMDGTGTMIWGKAAAKYKGEWSYGLPHGKGQYIDSLGNKYEGEFKLGYMWGQGVFKAAQGLYTYSGTMVMSLKHFDGKVIYGTKQGYEGQWVQDMMSGKGKYYMGENYFYEGAMSENGINGAGTLTTPDGIITGTFMDGKPHGFCEQRSHDGQQWAKGIYKKGKKNGKFTISSLGIERKITFLDDIEITE